MAGPDGRDEAPWAQLPDGLQGREVRSRVPRHGCRVQASTLVTTLVDAELYRVAALSPLDFASWGMETHEAPLNTTRGLDVLTGQTVDGVLQELLVFALLDNLVRLVMGPAAPRHHLAIDRIRFIAARRWLAAARDHALLITLVVNPPRP